MKAFIERCLSVRASDMWYFNYGAWGILAFLFYGICQITIASIYGIGSLIAYGIAHALLKQEK